MTTHISYRTHIRSILTKRGAKALSQSAVQTRLASLPSTLQLLTLDDGDPLHD